MAEVLIVLSYADLQSGRDLSSYIEKALGPSSLGIIAIRDVPGYEAARMRLLLLALRLNELPASVKESLEDPASKYNFGWSHGKESLKTGSTDTHKASFYANPLVDQPECTPAQLHRYPVYCRPNIWPSEHLPELETAFKALGGLILGVGKDLLRHCDAYVFGKKQGNGEGKLLRVVSQSQCHKARLLLYLPPATRSTAREAGGTATNGVEATAAAAEAAVAAAEAELLISPSGNDPQCDVPSSKAARSSAEVRSDSTARDPVDGRVDDRLWCEWHLDHGSLTGLASAQFYCNGQPVTCPDSSCGLVIRNREGREIRVSIPSNCIAFQVGQAMSIHSGGLLQATPHCVKAPSDPATCTEVSRATYAVFMQPNWDEPLDAPGSACVQQNNKDIGPWTPGMDFGTFSERVVQEYY